MPKRFYTALAILLAAVMALSFLPIHGETEIYDTVVRLHVLANSDSEEDQALKLTVRDAVLEITTPLLRDCPDRATAAARIEDNREAIRTAAEAVIAAAGRDDLSGTVTVELGEETYPRRRYADCTLPAGRYLSLRIGIGEAAGHNWWCVLFPALCTAPAERQEDEFVTAGFTPGQIGVLSGKKSPKYAVRFRILELLGELEEKLK